jgi:hypothetical protein
VMSAASMTWYESFFGAGYYLSEMVVELVCVASVDRTIHAIALETWAATPSTIFFVTPLPPSSRKSLLVFRYFCVRA